MRDFMGSAPIQEIFSGWFVRILARSYREIHRLEGLLAQQDEHKPQPSKRPGCHPDAIPGHCGSCSAVKLVTCDRIGRWRNVQMPEMKLCEPENKD